MIQKFGTADQRAGYLPRMATGELRSAYSMTEPHGGSDVQANRTRARREEGEYIIDGRKMWATNGLCARMIMLLAVTDPDANPRHKGITAFIIEKDAGVHEQSGLSIPPQLNKLGYKGVETTEFVFDVFRTPVSSVLGGEGGVGQGFKYFMRPWRWAASTWRHERSASRPRRSKPQSSTPSSERLSGSPSRSIRPSS
jgi:butyryl-CoA dehydrogenase